MYKMQCSQHLKESVKDNGRTFEYTCSFHKLTFLNTIADIDECEQTSTNDCDQLCYNDGGGYHCRCRDGYTLAGVGNCIGRYGVTSSTKLPQ